ncbi:TPA: response regulator [Patescibacteria group bacterium]|nr:MAG: DNA-binding response regulator VicR [Parcubacteria group bacterium GW2011_GWF2_40_10]KKR47233.1 MAG: DNA-binding response regulator VicR [Parcubacteria group bacterium GW2011_GWA2_40_143]KKR60197.1 MAG: DNA-binding response regulator VicR [Parcubacteria group bacterium GW2011_GWC2_40_31]KKR77277.1 MAG: DNA-binding response regulator VicR [Parcubacteria group bacterium GW2011_GWE2_40_8]KKR83411.1 MAG: DNA-binding response regulator VicR [Parcubacteria group bacterium GW2011_GWD2_40_9]HB
MAKKKILIVEDDSFLLSVLSDKFNKDEYDIEAASDGETGLQKAREGNYDLVLLDIVLPGMDGIGVLREIRDHGPAKPVPVVMLSNLYDKTSIDNAMLLGAKDYIVKAYSTPEDIVKKVRKYISNQEDDSNKK